MKKITLLVAERERDSFLSALRQAGVVHIKGIKEPVADDLPLVEKQLSTIDKALSALSPYEKGKVQKAERPGGFKPVDLATKIVVTFYEKERLSENFQDLRRQEEWFEEWGAVDPEDMAKLKEKGVNIRLYVLRKEEFKRIKNKESLKVIRKDKRYVYLALISYDPEEKLDFEEVVPPVKSAEKVAEEIKDLKKKIDEKESFFNEMAGEAPFLKDLRKAMVKKLELLAVKFGMQEEETFSYLQGFCPSRYVDRVLALAKDYGFGYLVEEPDRPEETPTYITNPRWVDIIRPVFRFMRAIPGYNEFDISFFFLIFFSLFFAMLVGDAGYGTLFALITFLVRRKAKHLPAQPFFLMYLLSGATIVWGAVTGTWFGTVRIAIDHSFMIFICFLIGAVHLTIAHLTKGFRVINSPRSIAEVGWVSIVWGMFYAAGTLVIARPFPQFAGYLLGAGSLLVLVFANFQRNVLKGMLATLVHLPLNVISAFSDVVSYLRLFAVGYATVIVAQSFNDLAVGGGVRGIIGGVLAVLILFFGHALNILLALMAVIVHGIRLNMLEFSSHLGMQWSGKEYKPFSE